MHKTVRMLPCLAALSLPAITLAAEPPKVLTTLKPLQLITTAITEGVTTPELLLGANTSPHDYQMKPSDMKKLASADLVIWVGPSMENFLVKPLSRQDVLLTLQDVVDEDTEVSQDEHGHENHQHEEDAHHASHDSHQDDHHKDHEDDHAEEVQDDHHGHSHGGTDPHIWLSPDSAEKIAVAISQKLSEIDPAHSSLYDANLEKFTTELTQLDLRISQQLSSLQGIGYFVFHDAYSQFESHYGLNHLDAFTLSPEIKPGAKKLNSIRNAILDRQVACVFKEPQFTPAVVTAITKGLDVNIGELDPLASNVEVSASGYFGFLQSLADSFEQCLRN